MKPVARKTIGVLGGMGPVSSAHFYQLINTISQKEYGAVEEWDFPPVILYSLPVTESTDEGFNDIDAALPILVPALRVLENAGADFIVIPCNTAHCFLDKLQASVTIPIVSMVEAVVEHAKKHGCTTLGVMGTKTTVQTQLYVGPAEKLGMKIANVTDAEQKVITTAIGNVTAGRDTPADREGIGKVAEALQSRGADWVVLGCTELPLVLTQEETKVPVISSVGVLAEAAVRRSNGTE